MKKLPLLTGKKLGKIIVKIGYKYDHTCGNHMTFINIKENKKITIPNHSSESIRPGFLLKIKKKTYE